MPGVNVTTATRTGPASASSAAAATYFVVGQTEKGPTNAAVEVRSLADYVATFGSRVTYGSLYDDLRVHFEEGGVAAQVARVVGPAATKATVTLSDRAGVPVATLKIDAANPGSWGAGISVTIADGSVAGTFDLTVVDNTNANAVLETYKGCLSPADAAARLAKSAFVRGTDQGSVTAAPNNNPADGTFALVGGADDRASITAATYTGALDTLFGADLGSGIVAIPGQPAGTVGAGIRAHCAAHSRIAALADTIGNTAAQVKVTAAALGAGSGEYVGVFYPSVQFNDGAVVRTVTPEGYVAACRARTVVADGPWTAPAGKPAEARFIIGTDIAVDRATGDDLDAHGVSAIRTIQGGTRLYGWRSLSADTDNYFLLTGRDTLNLLVVESQAILEDFVFKTIDGKGQVLANVKAELIGLVAPIAKVGGLYPGANDPGYVVDVGPSVNTAATLQANQLNVNLGVRTSPSADLVSETITKAAVSAAL